MYRHATRADSADLAVGKKTAAQIADLKLSDLTENREFLSQLFGYLMLI